MLLRADQSTVLVIDMQERLMPVIDRGEQVLATADKLARAARLLDVPVVATEHHSRMLGATVAPLREQVQATFQKMHFSAMREPGFEAWLPPARKTVLVTGCEAHICVLQTVLGLREQAGMPCWWPMAPARASRPTTMPRCGARARPARTSSPAKWRFSNGWRPASTRVSATCYVWSSKGPGTQHLPRGVRVFQSLDTKIGQTSQHMATIFAILGM